MYIYIYMYIYTCIRIDTCVNIYICTYTNTHISGESQGFLYSRAPSM